MELTKNPKSQEIITITAGVTQTPAAFKVDNEVVPLEVVINECSQSMGALVSIIVVPMLRIPIVCL